MLAAGAPVLARTVRRSHLNKHWSRGYMCQHGIGRAAAWALPAPSPSFAEWLPMPPLRAPLRATPLRCRALRVENRELLVCDTLLLLIFAVYRQIASIVLHPDFPGWLAPLAFRPTRFFEFAAFATTLCCAWVTCSLLIGGYSLRSTQDVPTALRVTSLTWLTSMPITAAQLVLSTAASSRALVGDEGFGTQLPLAVTGLGEPLVSAAGVLGLMSAWRAFYAARATSEAASVQEAFYMVGIQALLSLVALQGMHALLTLRAVRDAWEQLAAM